MPTQQNYVNEQNVDGVDYDIHDKRLDMPTDMSQTFTHVTVFDEQGNPGKADKDAFGDMIDTSPRVVQQTATSVNIDPNVLNLWGSVNSLNILLATAQTGRMNEYMMQFTVGSADFALSLPSDVRWVEEPTWEQGSTYQVSIVNSLAIYAGWEEAPANQTEEEEETT